MYNVHVIRICLNLAVEKADHQFARYSSPPNFQLYGSNIYVCIQCTIHLVTERYSCQANTVYQPCFVLSKAGKLESSC